MRGIFVLLLCALASFLSYRIARADNVAAMISLQVAGSCTLNGAATAVCTATVPSSCRPICAYRSSVLPHIVSCDVSGSTLTVLSATTLDSGVATYACF